MMDQTVLSTERVREFVIAGHGDLPAVQRLLAETPALLDAAFDWGNGDWESAIQAAAHVGHAPIAEYLLAQGAPLAIYTAAMLGRWEDVERILEDDPGEIDAVGAHGIPLLAHAAFSGDALQFGRLYERGARAGASLALHNAVSAGHLEVVRWLLENASPDLGQPDFRGKTPLAVAMERDDRLLVDLLRAHGAPE